MIRHHARKETALRGWGAVQGETAGCLTPAGGWVESDLAVGSPGRIVTRIVTASCNPKLVILSPCATWSYNGRRLIRTVDLTLIRGAL